MKIIFQTRQKNNTFFSMPFVVFGDRLREINVYSAIIYQNIIHFEVCILTAFLL